MVMKRTSDLGSHAAHNREGRVRFSWSATAIALLGLLASCATISRWDSELKAHHECRRRLCHELGRVLVSKEIPGTRLYSYHCCLDDQCEDARDDCTVTL